MYMVAENKYNKQKLNKRNKNTAKNNVLFNVFYSSLFVIRQ